MNVDPYVAVLLIVIAITWLVVACVIVGARKERPVPPEPILFVFMVNGATVGVVAYDVAEAHDSLRQSGYSVQAIQNSILIESAVLDED